MKNENGNWSTITCVAALLIGVILFWSFGRDWLNFESALVFLAGLIGVTVAVLIFAVWNVYRNSHHKKN
jgi:hypothetical protein